MAELPSNPAPFQSSGVFRSEGVTAAERYLAKLCGRSFLSLWSYPGVFRDQGRTNGKGDGKELCDLLVVFENHIFIFSDKDCHFADSGKLDVDWGRWYRKAILQSAKQVWGAERWIRDYPGRLFLDKQCTKPFPLLLPDPATAIFHRIVVAHDGSRRCKEVMGGSGSMMVKSSLVGDEHLNQPFWIGQVDPAKGYVHIFDDTTLDNVMSTLDTISDFTAYLVKKEQFLNRSNPVITAAGEEELLAVYLTKLNSVGEHDFVVPSNYNLLSFDEGFWERFVNSSERKAQIEQDRISYSWDALIEKFLSHAMGGTQYFTCGNPLHEQEKMFRFMAREPRTRRRILASGMLEVLERSTQSVSPWDARVVFPSKKGDPYYVFLFLKRRNMTDKEYRDERAGLLSSYCQVVKLTYLEAEDIIGIATEDGKEFFRSEDLMYLPASGWNSQAEAQARNAQQRLGLLKKVKMFMSREHEYPVDHTGKPKNTVLSRNSSCRCGSGQRYKRCCGRGYFERRRD